ncbi:glutamine--fructose-6-phosphate transaminase (isomerizing) [bacterium]|nr:glutamine--fructose-6-phosphate transaminase (isomerizing) [bacterium]NBW56474.1 glutamine--fructose-6-phosphate transaminase (isomerizing) [bacterium]NBX72434.1 glutamine--fructose-6-phosphate transaminase (isomerizing) [bacterium]
MCGIIGGVTLKENIAPLILKGLKRLEYRGYDSSGIVVNKNDQLQFIRKIGAPTLLAIDPAVQNLEGFVGLGHNRWATHGPVTEANAHPHVIDNIALVHNGVLENVAFVESLLRPEIKKLLRSDTDSELILAYLYQSYYDGLTFLEAFEKTIKIIEGSFALLVLHAKENIILARRHYLPLYYSQNDGRHLLSSDIYGFPPNHHSYHVLIEDNTFVLKKDHDPYYVDSAIITSQSRIDEITELDNDQSSFMQKEIIEQAVILEEHLHNFHEKIAFFHENFFDEIHLVGCGTSYHAALTSVFWFEELAGVPARAFIASEFKYFPPVVKNKTLLIALSQSGETADVLAAIQDQGKPYAKRLAICNNAGSMLTRLVDHTLLLKAGREVGVASTKAFTAQLIMLLKININLTQNDFFALKNFPSFLSLPQSLTDIFKMKTLDEWAKELSQYRAMMILGRGPLYPIAMEAALKLKEITYKHVHSLPASELKHGSLALIDKDCPVLMIIPNDHLLKKNLLTCEEIAAREGKLFIIFEESIDSALLHKKAFKVAMPSCLAVLNPIMFIVPFQLLAIKIASILNYDIDKPRNLAKSVTVE